MRLLRKIIAGKSSCNYCTKPERNVAKSIYFSKCTDIFTNLALEDWLYKNRDFTDHHLLMLWRNEPCVVIGRHQNPWLECNFATLPSMKQGVKLARRNSGGGTVYHDMENLNLTFFTSREEYSRRRNLEIISRALKNSFGINSEINKREDLCIDDCKISGTASKLGRTSAYHHCTLLVNANKSNISLALKNIIGPNVKTNASISVRSKIMNLTDAHPGITVDEVMEAIILEYSNNLGKHEATMAETGENMSLRGVNTIEAIDDEHFPGVTEIKKTFLSAEWRFERTPKFTIYRDIFDNNDLLNNSSTADGDSNIVTAFLAIEKGRVSNAGIKSKYIDLSIRNNNLGDLSDLFNGIMEMPFSKDVLDAFDMVACGLRNSDTCRTMVANR